MLKWLRREPKSAPAATRGSIEIRRPWARQAMETPEQAGGFFTLTNKGTEPDRLVAASSPAAGKIEIHAIKVVGGDVGMRPREDGLAAPAGVTLIFEKAGNIDVELLVEAPGPVGTEVLGEERQRG